jgi:hypothetical protein
VLVCVNVAEAFVYLCVLVCLDLAEAFGNPAVPGDVTYARVTGAATLQKLPEKLDLRQISPG